MSQEEQTKIYMSNIASVRGTVLNHVIVVERLMDEFISSYFAGSSGMRKAQLFELLSEETNFNTKRVNLERIIKASFPEKYDKATFTDLRELMEERNVFAHWVYDTRDSATDIMNDGRIQFFRFRISKNEEGNNRTYGETDIEAILRRADRCVKYLTTLNLMGDHSSPDSSGPVI